MNEILIFKNHVWDGGYCQDTIEGEDFRTLMDLCFARADSFSLHRSGWPGAQDGPLEQALRPYLLGEYFFDSWQAWFDREARDKSYLYPANDETKAIFLAHIPHLFGREIEPPDAEPEKYAPCRQAMASAWERFDKRCDALGGAATGEACEAIRREEFQAAQALWREIFDEGDFQSFMDDPWFFRGEDMFVQIVTHESECLIQVPDEPFGAELQKLGKWEDISRRLNWYLGSLTEVEGLVWYGKNG